MHLQGSVTNFPLIMSTQQIIEIESDNDTSECEERDGLVSNHVDHKRDAHEMNVVIPERLLTLGETGQICLSYKLGDLVIMKGQQYWFTMTEVSTMVSLILPHKADHVYFEELPLLPKMEIYCPKVPDDKNIYCRNLYDGDYDTTEGHWMHFAIYKYSNLIVITEACVSDCCEWENSYKETLKQVLHEISWVDERSTLRFYNDRGNGKKWTGNSWGVIYHHFSTNSEKDPMCGPLVVKACEYSFKGKFSWDDFHSEVKLSQLKDEVVDDLQQNLVQFLRHSDKYRSQFDEDELNYLKNALSQTICNWRCFLPR